MSQISRTEMPGLSFDSWCRRRLRESGPTSARLTRRGRRRFWPGRALRGQQSVRDCPSWWHD